MSQTIIAGSDYNFSVPVTLAGAAVQFSEGDEVKAYLDKTEDASSPVIEIDGVLDDETDGLVHFEMSATDTSVPPGTYHRQVFYFPVGTQEKHTVYKDTVVITKGFRV